MHQLLTQHHSHVSPSISPAKEPSSKFKERFSLGIDLIIIVLILLNVLLVILETIPQFNTKYTVLFVQLEWIFTAIFTIEYLCRAVFGGKLKGYVFTGNGLLDLIAISPQYIAFLLPGANQFEIVRILRLARLVTKSARLGKNIGTVTKNAFDLKDNVTASEKHLLYFRQSRSTFFATYFFGAILLAVLSYLVTHPLTGVSLTYSILLGYGIMIIILLAIMRKEIHIWSTRYSITTHRVNCSKGIFSEELSSLSFHYVTDVTLDQSFVDKILNIGTITIHTAGERSSMVISGVYNPAKIKNIIQEVIVRTHHKN